MTGNQKLNLRQLESVALSQMADSEDRQRDMVGQFRTYFARLINPNEMDEKLNFCLNQASISNLKDNTLFKN